MLVLRCNFYRMASALFSADFHNFPFSRPLSLMPQRCRMPWIMTRCSSLFIIVAGKLFGIGAYRIKADKEITAQAVAFAIVKSDDVGIIIMLKILPVYFENFSRPSKKI